MSKRPTENAKARFGYANQAGVMVTQAYDALPISDAKDQVGHHSIGVALAHLSKGLIDLSDGLRATYILLEDVKTLLERQSQVASVPRRP